MKTPKWHLSTLRWMQSLIVPKLASPSSTKPISFTHSSLELINRFYRQRFLISSLGRSPELTSPSTRSHFSRNVSLTQLQVPQIRWEWHRIPSPRSMQAVHKDGQRL